MMVPTKSHELVIKWSNLLLYYIKIPPKVWYIKILNSFLAMSWLNITRCIPSNSFCLLQSKKLWNCCFSPKYLKWFRMCLDDQIPNHDLPLLHRYHITSIGSHLLLPWNVSQHNWMPKLWPSSGSFFVNYNWMGWYQI